MNTLLSQASATFACWEFSWTVLLHLPARLTSFGWPWAWHMFWGSSTAAWQPRISWRLDGFAPLRLLALYTHFLFCFLHRPQVGSSFPHSCLLSLHSLQVLPETKAVCWKSDAESDKTGWVALMEGLNDQMENDCVKDDGSAFDRSVYFRISQGILSTKHWEQETSSLVSQCFPYFLHASKALELASS